MPLSANEKKYLKNKHKGGRNNAKGNKYESFYTVFRIALLIHRYRDRLTQVVFSSQLKNTFVDDLQITFPENFKTYHQIKCVKNLRWDQRLISDFKRQKDISEENNENFELRIIYSDQSSPMENIPTEINTVTKAFCFPYYESINSLLLSFSEFKNAIHSIAANPMADDNELSDIATVLLGVWNAYPHVPISLQEIVEHTTIQGKGYINITGQKGEISHNCKKIFESITDFKYEVNGNVLYWTYKEMKGNIAWTIQLDEGVQKSNPQTFSELIALI